MNAAEALARLRRLAVPVVRTSDAAAALGVTVDAANKTLTRLAKDELVTSIRRGVWTLDRAIDPILLPEHLTAPYPSYVSLQSALFLRGWIEQIPSVVYAITLARSGRMRTSVATFSFHHVEPRLFDGFETTPAGVKLALPEKALVDLLYLSAGKTRLFASLPEIDLSTFRPREAARWIKRIPSPRLRTMTERRLAALLARRRVPS